MDSTKAVSTEHPSLRYAPKLNNPSGGGDNQKDSPNPTLLCVNHPSDTRQRSTSLTHSVRSSASGITTTEEHPELQDKETAFKRQQTQRFEVKHSRWEMFKGLFLGPAWFSRRTANRIESDFDVEVRPSMQSLLHPKLPTSNSLKVFEEKDDPFKALVFVFPAKNPIPQTPLQKRCTFDTGCYQGNIVSLKLADELGFKTFEKLQAREAHGGTTITGEKFNPVGAVHLSWYHRSSGQVFKDMRFLVLADANIDLLIGAKSIVKNKLMAGPNFSIGQDKKLLVVRAGGMFFSPHLSPQRLCATGTDSRNR